MCTYVVEGAFIMGADSDPILPDISTTTPDENECTRLEIFERLALYYNVDDIAINSDSSSRRADRMFERDIKLLEDWGRVKAKRKACHASARLFYIR
jgi:hypothetical protein